MKNELKQGGFQKAGFIAIVGRPNVGKSSILNAVIKEKVAIVSPKPQTTRHKILGIYNAPNLQMVFCDTPGVITPKNSLGEVMMKDVKSAADDVDVVLIVISADHGLSDSDKSLIAKYVRKNKVIVAINKMDLVNYEKVFPLIAELSKIKEVKEVVPLSAKKRKNIDTLIDVLEKYMPNGDRFFDEETYTDKSVKFIASEIIREKALNLLNDEIPHGIFIEILKFDESGKTVKIDADIIVEKDNHKIIVIGKGGEKLKEIGAWARSDIEKLLGQKVMLKLFVKVRKNWRDDYNSLKNFEFK